MSRACNPICWSPISPSISARGVSAATESTTTIAINSERTRFSRICNASSPLFGCEINNSFIFTPMCFAYSGSSACSASINAHRPPNFCACAITESARVVFPDDSGPNISIIRPLGSPPTPNATSKEKEPVGIVSTCIAVCSPSFMIAPSPNLLCKLSIRFSRS